MRLIKQKIVRHVISSIFITSLAILGCSSIALAASFSKAQMLNDYGLKKEAKIELIDIIFDNSKNPNKAQAYYMLGSIAFEENKIGVALKSWLILGKKYPESKEAKLVKDRIQELSEIVGETSKESIGNAIALSYIRHGDFWSKHKQRYFTIDSSWITKFEASIKWFDKVINEFPRSVVSRIAYQKKLDVILGWKEPGKYGESYGIEKSFETYMPRLLKTFSSFEKEHPKASTLQGFRYQIAQAYWSNKNWEETRKWLKLIIQKSKGTESFYSDLAQRRLEKVEY